VISLWDSITRPGVANADESRAISSARPQAAYAGEFRGRGAAIALAALSRGSTLGSSLESLRGRSVLLATQEQLPAAIALLELDGVARRVVLCTPDVPSQRLDAIAREAEADALVMEPSRTPTGACGDSPDGVPAPTRDTGREPGQRPTVYRVTPAPAPGAVRRHASHATEWILLTSGTGGAPKLVVHTINSLAGALPRQPSGTRAVWSTFYDIRRFGGLQIYLRAVLLGVPLVLSSSGESIADFAARAGAERVTHISGTPSHWRMLLMSGAAAHLAPEYVRLSGEVADQALLDNLRAAFPAARIAHAFASTEAGVAFDVNDGLAGFPAEYIGRPGPVDLKVTDGTLHIRSPGNAVRYLGDETGIAGIDGYVDTGDLVERVDGRYYFRGRKGGVINVGGLKVYPEEVESVLNADPRVRMSRASARRNPFTGSVVVAEVVLRDPLPPGESNSAAAVKGELVNACRRALPAHKVPAVVRFVDSLEHTAAGKLVRSSA
jgi:acyl-coenzyme A synthetase/AMP-(fatty) acid ligase